LFDFASPQEQKQEQKKRARVPLSGLPSWERQAFFRPQPCGPKETTFVKNDLSVFALVHAYISDALFKTRTSSIACT
jgi:hypothetical protein